MAEKTYKCGWKHCRHPSPEIPSGEGVLLGKRWFHEDCAHDSETIQKIKELFYEQIDRAVVMKQLGSAVNNIVFGKGVAPDLVLFALKYAIKNNMPVRSPYSLHYLVTNYRVKEAWATYQKRLKAAEQAKKNAENKAEFTAPTIETAPKYEQNSLGFGSIFGNT